MFDGLAWIMMIFLFVLLAMVWTAIDNTEKKDAVRWSQSSQERQQMLSDIRALAVKVEKCQ